MGQNNDKVASVETRLTAEATEQFIKVMEEDLEYYERRGKHKSWLIMNALKHAEAFRDKSESALRAEIERFRREADIAVQLHVRAESKLRAKLAEAEVAALREREEKYKDFIQHLKTWQLQNKYERDILYKIIEDLEKV